MDKIQVTPESRDGVWLAEPAALKRWIEAQGFERVHSQLVLGPVLAGMAGDVAYVLECIDKATRIGVFTGDAIPPNRHALALILPAEGDTPERIEWFDIGDPSDHIEPLPGRYPAGG